ncbi:MAG: hypothetical protein M1828_000268 [Chrysothrix sp. TS-e1954]|nr:MAG: hypothetical protein M1828_000268 [Chrysothrix sp. TS-e1954]
MASDTTSSKLRVDNLHYELTESDLRELFTRIGPILTCQILYDKADRSRGTAFVTYHHRRDAVTAVHEFDGANAYGQPIKVALLPTGLGRGRGGDLLDVPASRPRSLFDRISEPAPRRRRSESPNARRVVTRRPAPDNIDRYVPDENRRSRDTSSTRPRGRDGGGRGGRRPGARRDDSGRPDRGRDEEGRPMRGGRPRKTAEQLDAEMSDYWGSNVDSITAVKEAPTEAKVESEVAGDGDIDMIE